MNLFRPNIANIPYVKKKLTSGFCIQYFDENLPIGVSAAFLQKSNGKLSMAIPCSSQLCEKEWKKN